MIAVVDFSPWISGIISFVFGGGIVTAIVALYKVKPEAGAIVVTAAQGALLVQTGVIENLQKEIIRLNAELNDIKLENSNLRMQVELLKNNQDRHDEEIKNLK